VIAVPAPIATLDGVMAPSISDIAGVVVGVATVPETPFAVTTETLVTLPEPPQGPASLMMFGPTQAAQSLAVTEPC
jgi:hypothetical protein